MNNEKINAVSLSLQTLADAIDTFFKGVAGGERQAFVLMVSTDKVVQYVSNASREDGTMLIKDLLAGWENNRADIPAHYNPDLKREPDEPRPIDMVLYCPKCGKQHIDAPSQSCVHDACPRAEPCAPGACRETWTNPPHRSHLCHECGTIWRPADVPTNGVAAIATKGKADTWVGKAAFSAPANQEAKKVAKHVNTIYTVAYDGEGKRTLSGLRSSHEPSRDVRVMDAAIELFYAAVVRGQDNINPEVLWRHVMGEPPRPDGWAYRYPDGFVRFNHGTEVNISRPIEAIPYYLGEPKKVGS